MSISDHMACKLAGFVSDVSLLSVSFFLLLKRAKSGIAKFI